MSITKTVTPALIAGSLLMASSVQAADLSAIPAGSYELDTTHAYVNFSYNHLGLSNPTLSFDDFDVNLDLNTEDPTQSSVSVTIEADSILAGSEIWKDHLTSADWFNTAEFPQITYTSTSIEAAGDGAYRMVGDLTIMETTQPVTLNVVINAAMMHPMSGAPVIGFDASGELLRSDFGLGRFAPNISDEIALNLSVELKAAE